MINDFPLILLVLVKGEKKYLKIFILIIFVKIANSSIFQMPHN